MCWSLAGTTATFHFELTPFEARQPTVPPPYPSASLGAEEIPLHSSWELPHGSRWPPSAPPFAAPWPSAPRLSWVRQPLFSASWPWPSQTLHSPAPMVKEDHQVGMAQYETGGVTQVLAFVSTYQSSILVPVFEPQPCSGRIRWQRAEALAEIKAVAPYPTMLAAPNLLPGRPKLSNCNRGLAT